MIGLIAYIVGLIVLIVGLRTGHQNTAFVGVGIMATAGFVGNLITSGRLP